MEGFKIEKICICPEPYIFLLRTGNQDLNPPPVEVSHVIECAYRDLHSKLKLSGLFDRDNGWLAWEILANFLMLICVIGVLATSNDLLVICLDAVLLAFVMVHFGFIGHDAQHGQIFCRRGVRRALGLVHWNLLTGLSTSWWQEKHVAHHVHTNVPGLDPDMFSLLTFSHEEAMQKTGFERAIARHQVWWYVPILGCAAAYFRWLSVAFLLHRRPSGFEKELALIVLHYLAYFGLLFYLLEPLLVMGFVVLNYVATGLYMGVVFSTNHMGMPLSGPTTQVQRVASQLKVTRNVTTGWLGDYLFGGLNYQIEHHLFPSLPRSRFRQASKHVRAFCVENNLPYHSCDFLTACRDIRKALHGVGAPLRVAAVKSC